LEQAPKAILFDLDDTLIRAYGDPRTAWTAVLDEFPRFTQQASKAAILEAIVDETQAFWADDVRSTPWRQRINEARREIVRTALLQIENRLNLELDAALAERLADRFSAYRVEAMTLFDGAHSLLDLLRHKGIKLALITNGSAEVQRGKLHRFDLLKSFDHIQIEGEVGFGKPDPHAYTTALGALAVDANETWMVGDHLEWDVAAPQRLGIFSVWFNPSGMPVPANVNVRPDRIISALDHLIEAR
jgi:putative hydrolase of the HAD superfamily